MGTKVTSHNQSGGITAQNVAVNSDQAPEGPASTELTPTTVASKRIWIYVGGGASFLASVAGVLEYLGIAPW